MQVEILSANTPGESVPLPGVTVQLGVAADPCSKTPLTLGGASATTNASGLAEFPNLTLNQSCIGYTLSASSGGFTTGVSSPFNVFDDIGRCQGNQDCLASFSGPTGGSMKALASSTTGPGFAQIAGSAEGVISCDGYDEVSGVMITFGASSDRANEVSILIDRSSLESNPGAGSLRVCYSSDHIVWTDRSDELIGDDEPLGTPSLLPDCANNNPVMPCQLPTRTSGQLFTVRFLSPPGATRGRT